jgi:hypothetical protein
MGKLLLLLFVVAILGGGFWFARENFQFLLEWGGPDNSTREEAEKEIAVFNAVNAWRESRVIAQIRKDDRLCPFVKRRSNEYAKGGTVSSLSQFLQSNGMAITIPYIDISELVGANPSPQAMVRLWSETEAQRQTLESTTLTYTCVRCTEQTCVQLMMTPKVL